MHRRRRLYTGDCAASAWNTAASDASDRCVTRIKIVFRFAANGESSATSDARNGLLAPRRHYASAHDLADERRGPRPATMLPAPRGTGETVCVARTEDHTTKMRPRDSSSRETATQESNGAGAG